MSFCPRVKVFARMPQKFWPRFFKMLANLPMASRLSLSCRPSGLHFAMQNRQTYRVRAAPAKRRFLLRAFLLRLYQPKEKRLRSLQAAEGAGGFPYGVRKKFRSLYGVLPRDAVRGAQTRALREAPLRGCVKSKNVRYFHCRGDH